KLDDPMGAFLMWRHHNTQLDLTSSQCSPFSKSKRIDARNSTKSYVAKTDRSAEMLKRRNNKSETKLDKRRRRQPIAGMNKLWRITERIQKTRDKTGKLKERIGRRRWKKTTGGSTSRWSWTDPRQDSVTNK
ncbi:hypothetical protein F443_22299, partial [Phytophthora nicotianae P1569]